QSQTVKRLLPTAKPQAREFHTAQWSQLRHPAVLIEFGSGGESAQPGRELVLVDATRVDARCGECIELLVQGLVPGGHPCVAELTACDWGSGCGHEVSMSQKFISTRSKTWFFEATFATCRSGLSSAPEPFTRFVSQLQF